MDDAENIKAFFRSGQVSRHHFVCLFVCFVILVQNLFVSVEKRFPIPSMWCSSMALILQAHLILQNYEDAVEAFQKVLSIEPSNRAAQKQVVQTRNKIKLSREREKQRYANMFDKLAGKRGQEAAK